MENWDIKIMIVTECDKVKLVVEQRRPPGSTRSFGDYTFNYLTCDESGYHLSKVERVRLDQIYPYLAMWKNRPWFNCRELERDELFEWETVLDRLREEDRYE